jgi:hypothetical protein
MDPKQWGPDVWRAVHLIALGYPERPSEDHQGAYRAFFATLGPVLPCQTCSVHYAENLRRLPLDDAIRRGGNALFDWSVELHNVVNRAHGKRTLTPKQAIQDLVAHTSANDPGSLFASLGSPNGAFALGLGVLIGSAVTALGIFAVGRLCRKR